MSFCLEPLGLKEIPWRDDSSLTSLIEQFHYIYECVSVVVGELYVCLIKN